MYVLRIDYGQDFALYKYFFNYYFLSMQQTQDRGLFVDTGRIQSCHEDYQEVLSVRRRLQVRLQPTSFIIVYWHDSMRLW